MNVLNDQVLGELVFNVFWSRPYNVEIFAVKRAVTLVVQTFEEDLISDNQRQAFDYFERNKKDIISDVEKSVLIYYRSNFNSQAKSVSDVAGAIDLLKVKIMYSEVGEAYKIGFIFDTCFDPELGVGVLVSNGKVEDVGVQDIVLG